MKSFGIFLLGIVLGALLHREYAQWARTGTKAVPVPAAQRSDAPLPREPQSREPLPHDVSIAAQTTSGGHAASVPSSMSRPPMPQVDAPDPDRLDAATAPGLLIPVQGKAPSDLADTFADSRSEGRPHEAIDIMAAAGTPVIAVSDGHVEKLFTSDRGGLTIYQFEPSGRYAYYYAHLQRYADGLHEKQSIRKGDVIGYVGATGNADPAAPHLHFAIFVLGPERQWWKGTAINPYPLLRRD